MRYLTILQFFDFNDGLFKEIFKEGTGCCGFVLGQLKLQKWFTDIFFDEQHEDISSRFKSHRRFYTNTKEFQQFFLLCQKRILRKGYVKKIKSKVKFTKMGLKDLKMNDVIDLLLHVFSEAFQLALLDREVLVRFNIDDYIRSEESQFYNIFGMFVYFMVRIGPRPDRFRKALRVYDDIRIYFKMRSDLYNIRDTRLCVFDDKETVLFLDEKKKKSLSRPTTLLLTK